MTAPDPQTPEPTTEQPATEQPADAAEKAPETDWKAEARKWEQRAKENKAKLAEAEPIVTQWRQLEEASKSELEKAQEAARTAAEREAATLHRVAAAEIKAALTGVVPDPAALLEDLNIGRFVNGEGEIDTAAIDALRTKYAALAPAPGMRPNPAQGTSAHPPLSVRERIAEAEKAGDLRTVLRLKAGQAVEASTNQG